MLQSACKKLTRALLSLALAAALVPAGALTAQAATLVTDVEGCEGMTFVIYGSLNTATVANVRKTDASIIGAENGICYLPSTIEYNDRT